MAVARKYAALGAKSFRESFAIAAGMSPLFTSPAAFAAILCFGSGGVRECFRCGLSRPALFLDVLDLGYAVQ